MIEGHGDDAWKYNVAVRADFSSNVLYGGLDEGLLEHLRSSMGGLVHYPEAGAQSLQWAAAEGFGVGKDQVLVTNGATEAIYLVAQVFRELAATIYVPAFAEYEDACRLQGMNVAFRDWEELRSGKVCGEGLVFLCNPNNPTGSAISLGVGEMTGAAVSLGAGGAVGSAVFSGMFSRYPKALFVVDESYIEFTRTVTSVLPVLHQHPNVLILRSLTKSCRIPGLRLGFLVGAAPLIARLRAAKMPWSVNRLAIEAGLYIFGRQKDFLVPVEGLLAETARWRAELKAATGWRVQGTDTHYFLIDTPRPLKMELLTGFGLLVRDASNFRGLGPHVIRVACQSRKDNLLLTKALAQCASTGS